MGYQIDIDEARERILVTITGVITKELLVDYQRDLWRVEGAGRYDELIDLRSAQAGELASETAAQHAQRQNTQTPRQSRRRSAVVVANPLMFGLTRVYLGHRDESDAELGIFYEIEEARAWLSEPRP